MSDLKWFFPRSGSECLDLFKAGFRPHGGGTFLIKTQLNTEGIFDTSRVDDYRRLEDTESSVIIGSAVTYFDAAEYVEKMHPYNFFSSALSSAASTPLRNRITVGGSIAAAPGWSDINGPLAAAGASVLFEDSGAPLDYAEYARDRSLRKEQLVSAVMLPRDNLKGGYYRFTLTGFDYPFFTISISVRGKDTFRCAVTGSKDDISVFSGDSAAIMNDSPQSLAFNDERGLSGEYIKNRALVELKRLLSETGGINA